MKRFTLALSGIALALGGSAIALAAAGPGHVLLRAEAQADAGRLFDRLDLNHDGKLDAADRSAHANAIFDKIDTNHDGQISRDEFLAAHEHMRGMMGPEHDGMGPDHMGRDHMGPERMGPERMAPGGPGMGPMGHEKWGHHPGHGMVLMAILHQADPQHTGTITREGFVNAALAMFDKADTNHDGKLTGVERKSAWAAARATMRHQPDAMHDHGRRGPGPDQGQTGMAPPPAPTHGF